MKYGPDGNPVGYDAGCVCATFDKPCPACGTPLRVTRDSYDWHQRVRIETECPACNGAWVWFASPATPDLEIGDRLRRPVVQMRLFEEAL